MVKKILVVAINLSGLTAIYFTLLAATCFVFILKVPDYTEALWGALGGAPISVALVVLLAVVLASATLWATNKRGQA